MNRRHAKVLGAVFTDPVSPSIVWADIEALFLAVGCHLIEGAGSRVRFEYQDVLASFHRPHPAKEAKRYQVRDARAFLMKIGAGP